MDGDFIDATGTSAQRPLGSGLGFSSTAMQALDGRDLRGRTAIVTGAYSGLGLETARVLAQAGAQVIVPARDTDRALAAVAHLPHTRVVSLDLTDPASIDAFAADFVASGQALHLLINSAGVMACPLWRDARGYEMQFSTNHLGHFQLALRLWPALARAQSARVVSVSSLGHRIAPVDFDDPHCERKAYDKWVAYGQSKTANVLFAAELDRRSARHGVRAYSLHPGAIYTGLTRHLDGDDWHRVGAADESGRRLSTEEAGFKTVEQGAATSVWCATSPLLADIGGVYCEDCDIAPLVPADSDVAVGVRPWAIDADAAKRLWSLSEEMTGVRWAA